MSFVLNPRRGRDSAEGYYRDAYDYEKRIEQALVPLGSPADCSYLEQVFDLEADVQVEVRATKVDTGTIVILDASFLLRPRFRDFFDYRVFVQPSFEEAQSRGVICDMR